LDGRENSAANDFAHCFCKDIAATSAIEDSNRGIPKIA
jgi:hypothetical protein